MSVPLTQGLRAILGGPDVSIVHTTAPTRVGEEVRTEVLYPEVFSPGTPPDLRHPRLPCDAILKGTFGTVTLVVVTWVKCLLL